MVNYKTIIAPIVMVLALAYGTITGHVISQSTQDEFVTVGATLIAAGVSIWGVIKSHKK